MIGGSQMWGGMVGLAGIAALAAFDCGAAPTAPPRPVAPIERSAVLGKYITVAPNSTTVIVGHATTFRATYYGPNGSPQSRSFSWSVSNAAKAKVSSTGVVTGLAAGTISVVASTSGVSGTAKLVVTADTTPPSVVAPVTDTTACQAGTPLRTITVSTASGLTTALNNAVAGDLIKLDSATYTGTFHISASGTSAHPIVVCGPRTAVVQTNSLSGYGFAFIVYGSHVSATGFTVTNSQQGIKIQGGSFSSIKRMKVYHTGQEAVKVHVNAKHDSVFANKIYDTGNVTAEYGEGVYIGTSPGQWCTWTSCNPDRTDSTVVKQDTVGPNVRAEMFDLKEGTRGGWVDSTVVDGTGQVQSQTWVDSWMELKGNGWFVRWNKGSESPHGDGWQVGYASSGYSSNNTFLGNSATTGPGYGYAVQTGTGNIVKCSNTASGFTKGTTNVTCTP